MDQNNNQKHGKSLLFLLFIGIIFGLAALNITVFTNSVQKKLADNKGNYEKTLQELDRAYTEEFSFKNALITINGAVSKILGKKQVNNVIKLNNGYLTVATKKQDMNEKAAKIKEFSDYLKEEGIPLLYVQMPYKISKYDPQLPIGIDDYSNMNADNLLEELAQNKINTLDIREKIYEEELNHYDLFFKTDHHWTVEAGFWAHIKILEEISNVLGVDNSNGIATNRDNYVSKIYEDYFLGSRGKRVGPLYAGVDDIALLIPTFETNMRIEIPTAKTDKKGSFEEVVYFKENNLDSKDYYHKDPYNTFLNSNREYCKITNKDAQNDIKIFVIKDSFSNVMIPFLSLNYSESHIYDLRKGTPEKMKEAIQRVQPDIVMIGYSPNVFNDKKVFELPTKETRVGER